MIENYNFLLKNKTLYWCLNQNIVVLTAKFHLGLQWYLDSWNIWIANFYLLVIGTGHLDQYLNGGPLTKCWSE